jgi:hypothetical protein
MDTGRPGNSGALGASPRFWTAMMVVAIWFGLESKSIIKV